MKYTGFLDYVKYGEFTENFIKDFEYWAKKIFKRWTLFIDFDEFYSNCWYALCSKIHEFDSNIATIQTFCISRINNEAWRQYQKNKQAHIVSDIEDPVIFNQCFCENENDFLFYDFLNYLKSYDVDISNIKSIEDLSYPYQVLYARWVKKNVG